MTISVISIWQPYASLAIHGHKMNETRGWKAPASLIGKRFGIAATKTSFQLWPLYRPDRISNADKETLVDRQDRRGLQLQVLSDRELQGPHARGLRFEKSLVFKLVAVHQAADDVDRTF